MSQIIVNAMINMAVEQHRWRYTQLLAKTAVLNRKFWGYACLMGSATVE